VLWKVLSDEKLAGLLGAAPLNGELFAELDLDAATISNRDLLEAFRFLAYYQESASSPPRRVNYGALDTEELGSVYESLLDYYPAVTSDAAGRPSFELRPGSERKSTGSYYTAPELVAELVRSALEPVLAERLKQAKTRDDKEEAVLSLRVLDPACGSGHFLLAAARRLGKELARIRTGEQEPTPEQVRPATRDVIARCIYGVDKNPLAVELCRLALWLEAIARVCRSPSSATAFAVATHLWV
jgi:type I restriction-modification system DNA methylase subunit